MSIKISTGLRNHLLVTGSLRAAFNNASKIQIFGGPQPATADDATTGGTLLIEVMKDGTDPITFGLTVSDGVVLKTPAEVWNGNAVATGTAAWFRLVLTADAGAASTTALRLQGTVGLAGADLVLTSTAITALAPQAIDYGALTLPLA